MAKILITGICGSLGLPLSKELIRRGHEVWGCDIKHTSLNNYIRADIREYRQMEMVLEQNFDYVYHLAAEFGRINGEHYYETLWTTNVVGTRNILELQLKKSFTLIFASSSEIYGDGGNGELLTEDLPNQTPLFQQNDYATSKWVNELQCRNFIKKYESPIITLRFFNAYGPGELYHHYRSVVCLFCYRALHRLPYTVYDNYKRVFMYIDDFIPTLANAHEKGNIGEIYNIGGDEYTSVNALNEIILNHLSVDDSLVTYLPEDKHNIKNKRPDISKAINELNHKLSIDLNTGVKITLDWMKEVYKDTIKVK